VLLAAPLLAGRAALPTLEGFILLGLALAGAGAVYVLLLGALAHLVGYLWGKLRIWSRDRGRSHSGSAGPV
jgi:hypothetical protein